MLCDLNELNIKLKSVNNSGQICLKQSEQKNKEKEVVVVIIITQLILLTYYYYCYYTISIINILIKKQMQILQQDIPLFSNSEFYIFQKNNLIRFNQIKQFCGWKDWESSVVCDSILRDQS
eukprot:TRINITY_DN2054_c0_g1_i3.p3 TRINITY_DN2054_c0_g1~~TRINITY_DN2054_c0_g1_i3.p3  ORF type:complete len:121 (-),score=1.47 TRINITY_DN2054_c0_g1_i3:263-625(-)